MIEEWREVLGFSNYEISNMGNVRHIHNKEIPKISINRDGYKTVFLKKYKCYSSQFLHRLVAMTFIRPFLKGEVTNHKNSIRSDNRLENLEICTHQENMIHAKINKRWVNSPKPWSYKKRLLKMG